jgi:dihydrofolate reductase
MMAKLIYVVNQSLDGYMEDQTGKFDWSVPDDELHSHFNDLIRGVGTFLYGRRMYEAMAVWETDQSLAAQSPIMADFAKVWQAADKIVYSTTLASAPTARTRIERRFDPEAVRRLVESATRDVMVGGPELAAHAFMAGLVDEVDFYVVPIIVGGGKPSLPHDVLLRLELLDEHRFAGGVVRLHYRTLK